MRSALLVLWGCCCILASCGPSPEVLEGAREAARRGPVVGLERARSARDNARDAALRLRADSAIKRAQIGVSNRLGLAMGHAQFVSGERVAPDGTVAIPCLEVGPKDMACVPGGPFVRGFTGDEHTCQQRFGSRKKRFNAKNAARVWQQTVYMDMYEVTYANFKACIKAGGCDVRPEDGKWGPLYSDFSRDQQPVTGVSWFQSTQYCAWRGKHLPTEAEWEKAARGPDGELNPWGNAPATCDVAVIKDPKKGRSCGVEKRGSKEKGRVLVVGSRPPARYGLYDMVGNVEEWVDDWYTHDYEDCGEDCLGINPRGPCGGGPDTCPGHRFKIVKGGSWYWEAEHGTGYHRRPHWPENTAPKRFHHFGFRCAASPEEARALVGGE